MTLAERIKLRLDRMGKTERGASLEAGLSDSFIRNIRLNKSGSPRIDTLEKIAAVLEVDPLWLMTGEAAAKHAAAGQGNGRGSGGMKASAGAGAQDEVLRMTDLANAKISGRFALSERRLPVYGQAVGGIDGEFPMNGTALDSVLCPPQLSEASGAYAVVISGDSMAPRYEDGEIAFVDPTRRVRKGDYVIAQIISEEGAPPLAYVKKFIRHNAAELVLEQFNPARELRFPHRQVVSVHYIALAGTAPG